jgi:hypothetical protein
MVFVPRRVLTRAAGLGVVVIWSRFSPLVAVASALSAVSAINGTPLVTKASR